MMINLYFGIGVVIGVLCHLKASESWHQALNPFYLAINAAMFAFIWPIIFVK